MCCILSILAAIIWLSNVSSAATFKYVDGTKIEAPDFRTAARLCFSKLHPVYTTEEAGLDVIDICANGKLLDEK
jgi:hypothetical protein